MTLAAGGAGGVLERPRADDEAQARARLLFGTDEPVPLPRLLTAGPLTAHLDDGSLRWICWQGMEVLRGIAFIVRDARWGTLKPVLTTCSVSEGETAFSVAYRAEVETPDGRFLYRATITGDANGNLRFAAVGQSPTGFTTNRTGFVVLHGLDVAGRALSVHHPDGRVTRTQFPLLVQPDQPATEIARLVHEPSPGVSVDVELSGDVFEMEDQRNWTDASFKTYVRPLSRGFPYRIEPGEPLSQSVSVQVGGTGPARARSDGSAVTVQWGEADDTVLPRVGIYVDDETLQAAEANIAAAVLLRPGYLQARIDLRTAEATGRLARAMALADTCRCPLHLDVVVAGQAPTDELALLADWARGSRSKPEALFVVPARDLRGRATGILPPGDAPATAILAAVRLLLPGVRHVGGMPTGFPELNRNRPTAGIDMITHATQAVVHAADDASVMETLAAYPHVIATVRALIGTIPYRIGPATIGLPPSASASEAVRNPPHQRTPIGSRDPRQFGLFAAAFAFGLLASSRGVDALTLAALAGDCGLTDGTGRMGPLGAALSTLADAAGRPGRRVHHDAPGRLAAFAGCSTRGPALWLANLTCDPLDVTPEGPTSPCLWMLDAERLGRARPGQIGVERRPDRPLRLEAYAVCRIGAGPSPDRAHAD